MSINSFFSTLLYLLMQKMTDGVSSWIGIRKAETFFILTISSMFSLLKYYLIHYYKLLLIL